MDLSKIKTEDLQLELSKREGKEATYKGRRISGYAMNFRVHEDDYLSTLTTEERRKYHEQFGGTITTPNVQECDATDAQSDTETLLQKEK